MPKEMLINVSEGEECRIAIVEDGKLDELYMERSSSTSHVNNIYKGRVTNVEASIQAAFVDFGLGRNGFLHISDVMPTYFGKKGEHVTESVGQKMSRRDRPPIQRCLRRGDEIVVQVIKEGIGTKGPTLSTYLSVPGKILVMMPGMSRMGVSRKIEDDQERRRLRQILDSLDPPDDAGFIIRTAGVGNTKLEIERDLKYLTRLWETFKKRRDSGPGPMELYTEGDLVTRTVRDVFAADIERIIIDNDEVAERVREVLRLSNPRSKDRVELYDEPVPLLHKYGIERDIELMYSRHVPLPSGGSLVIDSTEAIVAIDVNSGKFREHNDAEMTAFKTDMEAADEICRQLKLRDLGGVIICDFIDLRFERNRRELENRLNENLKRDRAKTKVLRMSEFGIVEMTRQRMRPSLQRSVYFDCPQCKGAGLVKTPESMSLDVMRRLAIAVNDLKVVRVELAVCPDVSLYLNNKKRWALADLEYESKKRIVIRPDQALGLDEMRLELFDIRDGVVVLQELGDVLTPHRHTTQLGSRPPAPALAPRGADRSASDRHPPVDARRGQPARGTPRDEDDSFDRFDLDAGDDSFDDQNGFADREAMEQDSSGPVGPGRGRPDSARQGPVDTRGGRGGRQGESAPQRALPAARERGIDEQRGRGGISASGDRNRAEGQDRGRSQESRDRGRDSNQPRDRQTFNGNRDVRDDRPANDQNRDRQGSGRSQPNRGRNEPPRGRESNTNNGGRQDRDRLPPSRDRDPQARDRDSQARNRDPRDDPRTRNRQQPSRSWGTQDRDPEAQNRQQPALSRGRDEDQDDRPPLEAFDAEGTGDEIDGGRADGENLLDNGLAAPPPAGERAPTSDKEQDGGPRRRRRRGRRGRGRGRDDATADQAGERPMPPPLHGSDITDSEARDPEESTFDRGERSQDHPDNAEPSLFRSDLGSASGRNDERSVDEREEAHFDRSEVEAFADEREPSTVRGEWGDRGASESFVEEPIDEDDARRVNSSDIVDATASDPSAATLPTTDSAAEDIETAAASDVPAPAAKRGRKPRAAGTSTAGARRGRGRKTPAADAAGAEPATDAGTTSTSGEASESAPAKGAARRRTPAARPRVRRKGPGNASATDASTAPIATPTGSNDADASASASSSQEMTEPKAPAAARARSGPADRHLIDPLDHDERLAPEPARRPRHYRDLDAIPDDLD